MITCCVKSCSNQSRLNKRVSCNRLPDKRRKDKRDAKIKTINRSVLHKAIHVCSIQSIEDSFDESQELKRFLLGEKLKYLLKPDVFPFLPAHWKVGNKGGLFSLVVQDTDAIKFGKVGSFLFEFRIKKSQKEIFQYCNTYNECFWYN